MNFIISVTPYFLVPNATRPPLLSLINLNLEWIRNQTPSKVWDESIYPPQTSMVQPLKFGNGFVISSHILFRQLKFNLCVGCDMAFIEPMHPNEPNITYLRISHFMMDVITYACYEPQAISNHPLHHTVRHFSKYFTPLTLLALTWTIPAETLDYQGLYSSSFQGRSRHDNDCRIKKTLSSMTNDVNYLQF